MRSTTTLYVESRSPHCLTPDSINVFFHKDDYEESCGFIGTPVAIILLYTVLKIIQKNLDFEKKYLQQNPIVHEVI